MKIIILALCVLFTCQCAPTHAKEPHHAPHEGEVHDGGISDEDHYKHDEGHEHNPDYDHEAFMGKDEAHSYDEKAPEESKAKLADMFLKVDADGDGVVTEDEMTKWIHHTQNRYITKDSVDQMKIDDENEDGHVTWDEFYKKNYGFLDTTGVPKADSDQESNHRFDPEVKKENAKEHYAKLVVRDELRFKTADKNGDKKLDADEFTAFTHPETFDHMKDIVAKETLADMDKNKDGHVSMDEYLSDYWPEEERKKDPTEPEWLKDEKKTFTEVHDKNKDGMLDAKEVKEYSFPSEDDHVVNEAKHLIKESDTDGDGKISKDEMVAKYQTFIGSQATDFGDLLRDHEDL